MRTSPASVLAVPVSLSDAQVPLGTLLPSGFAFLRFVGGMRALLVAVGGLALLAHADPARPLAAPAHLVWLPYLAWSAFLLRQTARGWPAAASRSFFWLDATVLLLVSSLVAADAPLFSAVIVLPVVALTLLAGMLPGLLLAATCAAVLLVLNGWHHDMKALPPLEVGVPVLMLAFSPAVAALLVRPTDALRRRLTLLAAFGERSDPRQGLGHHVNVLLDLLAHELRLDLATLSLQGPEPRVFQWRRGSGTTMLAPPELDAWRARLATMPHDLGLTWAPTRHGQVDVTACDVHSGRRRSVGDALQRSAAAFATLHTDAANALVLPLMSYGQPLGSLHLARAQGSFDTGELPWIDGLMHEVLPLLERSDLLEQLQRESASRERERIGRDLHDSAVQPYLGLKYGLEALARRAAPDNPVKLHIEQLVSIASDELQTLRDVVSGLRAGRTTEVDAAGPIAALRRQIDRFQALYGLKVNLFAPNAPQLRGTAARAVLHMVNESLTNVRRHTSATSVTVLIDVTDTEVVMRLRNDHGRGEQLPADFVPRSLAERAEELGGHVSVVHQSDHTEVAIALPLLGVIA
jgi:signal transduction histidine kinase